MSAIAQADVKRDIVCRRPGINARVRKFFEDNPDEELTFKAVQEKFGLSRHMARKAVYALAELGVLESVHVIRRREKGIAVAIAAIAAA